MLLAVLGLAALCCATLHVGDAASQVATSGCQNADANTDKDLQTANSLMITGNYRQVDIGDFQREFRLTIYGWKLPWNISLEVSPGLLGFGNMSRSGDSMECLTESTSILYSGISYDHAEFAFSDATVKFRGWEEEGLFTHRFRPSVNVTLAKDDTFGCRVATSPVRSVEDRDYGFQSKTWKGWFLGLLLRHALLYGDDTPMVKYFQQASYSLIGTVLTDPWCKDK